MLLKLSVTEQVLCIFTSKIRGTTFNVFLFHGFVMLLLWSETICFSTFSMVSNDEIGETSFKNINELEEPSGIWTVCFKRVVKPFTGSKQEQKSLTAGDL